MEARKTKEDGTVATRTPIELAHLLRCPLRALKATWARVQHKRDMFVVVDMASHWPVVTPLYSGLEQALKVLAAHSLGVPVEVATAKGGILRRHDVGHDLGAIWKHIAPEAQATLEEHWQQFTSLHDYLLTGEAAKDGLATAEGFLRHLSGEKGQGYENWRYCLIQMQEVPKVSTEGMLQLWESVVEVYDSCARPERKRPVRGPLEWVELRVHQAWEHARFQACIQIQEGARRNEYDIEAIGRSEIAWIRRHGGYANAAEQILWHRERGLRAEDEPERFEARETLRMVGDALPVLLEKTEDANLRVWGTRAQHDGVRIERAKDGHGPRCTTGTRHGKGRWSEQVPAGSTVVELDSYTLDLAMTIRQTLYEAGHSVEEHKQVQEGTPTGFWLLFEGTKSTDGKTTTVAVWQSREPGMGRLAVTIDGDRKEQGARMTAFRLEYYEREEKGEILGSRLKTWYGNADDTRDPRDG